MDHDEILEARSPVCVYEDVEDDGEVDDDGSVFVLEEKGAVGDVETDNPAREKRGLGDGTAGRRGGLG